MRFIIIIFILFINLYAVQKDIIIHIKGMTCPLCTSTIKKSLKNTKGVLKAKVYLNKKIAKIKYDDKKTNINILLKAIKNVGYISTINNKGGK